MVLIRNPDALKAIKDSFQVQSGMDPIPDQAVPVMDITPRNHRTLNILRSSTATGSSATVYTTPSDIDFYLSAISIAYSKDATQDSANGSFSMTATIDGASIQLARIPYQVTTAQQLALSISFPFPIKIDRGTAISIARGSSTVGTFTMNATIAGYLVNPQ